jgi:hypothetical protein
MTTITIDEKYPEAKAFLKFVSTLPFVTVNDVRTKSKPDEDEEQHDKGLLLAMQEAENDDLVSESLVLEKLRINASKL